MSYDSEEEHIPSQEAQYSHRQCPVQRPAPDDDKEKADTGRVPLQTILENAQIDRQQEHEA